MRYVDEFRDAELGRALAGEILATVEPGRHLKLMEVCGGHTHSIYKYGVDDLLPANVELVHGPGCPVCVIPMGRVDDGISIAHEPGVIFTCFGDMMRVPGSTGTLLEAKAAGADVRMVYSPLDALRIAKANPDRQVVFFAIGFETTAPSTALTLKRARRRGAPPPWGRSGERPRRCAAGARLDPVNRARRRRRPGRLEVEAGQGLDERSCSSSRATLVPSSPPMPGDQDPHPARLCSGPEGREEDDVADVGARRSRSMTRRSMPMPRPPVGGRPYSRARR